MFKRILATVAVGGMLVAASVGAASALQVNGALGNAVTEQAGTAADFSCDDDGVIAGVYGYEADDQSVGYLHVSGIDADCAGKTLGYQITDEGGALLVPNGATTVVSPVTQVDLPNRISVEDLGQIKLAILGDAD